MRYTQAEDSVQAVTKVKAGWFGAFLVAFFALFLGAVLCEAVVAVYDGNWVGVYQEAGGLFFCALFFGWLPVLLLGRQRIRLSREGLESRFSFLGVRLVRRFVPWANIRKIDSVYESGDEDGAMRLRIETPHGLKVWGVTAEDDEVTALALRLAGFRKQLMKKS